MKPAKVESSGDVMSKRRQNGAALTPEPTGSAPLFFTFLSRYLIRRKQTRPFLETPGRVMTTARQPPLHPGLF